MLEERAAQWKDEYIQQGMLIGEAKGRVEGEAKGRVEGEAKGRVEGIGLALRDLLEARFGTLPQDVISSITSSSDSEILRKLMLFAFHAESLQAFIDQLKKEDASLM